MRRMLSVLERYGRQLGSTRTAAAKCPSFQRIPRACTSQPLSHAWVAQTLRATYWEAQRPLRIAAAGREAGAKDGADSAATPLLPQKLPFNLPQYCCGCGVRLQQEDSEAPGYFQIPKWLLDQLQEGNGIASSDLEPADEEVKQLQRLDRKAEKWLDEQQRPANPGMVGPKPRVLGLEEEEDTPALQCARCHSLTHYGRIKSEAAEAQLPEFDLAKKVGRKIALQKDRRAVVLVVVDVWDFDGSLPRTALTALFPSSTTLPREAEDLPFQLMVAVNKFDLLPRLATARRVEQWVRGRLVQAGLPRPDRVFMISSVTGFGVKDMLGTLKTALGFRADLWVVGAQNAGKSSLIAAMKQVGGTGQIKPPTIAPVPGTTLGLLRVPGIPLGAKHRVFDTPGVHHPYQLTSKLNLEELAMVLPRRQLKARTYRLGEGYSIQLGGLAQVDVVKCPSATMYLTVFVSDSIVTHMGKTAGAAERREKHGGGLLVPPKSHERLEEWGPLLARDCQVVGSSWSQHTKDVAIAGLGWIGVGVEGAADLRVWTLEGVSITIHDALVPDYAQAFQKPGFSKLLPLTKSDKAGSRSSSGRSKTPSGRK